MGAKNRKIFFLRKDTETDNIGQQKVSWVLSGHFAYAEISPVTGRLYFEAAKNNEESTVLFKIRYSGWMSELNQVDWRVRYRGKDYRIKQLANVKERNGEIHLRGVSVNGQDS